MLTESSSWPPIPDPRSPIPVITVLTALIAMLCSIPAFAQQVPTDDPVASAPIRLGAVGVRPRFTLSNAGVDTNVFNTVDNRQRDFTFTTAPGADI